MAQPSTIFTCVKCDAQSPKWAGRCVQCGAWGTLREEIRDSRLEIQDMKSARGAEVKSFAEIDGGDVARLTTGIGEVDRALGGGIVPGSLTLLGGEPGIGKSTLVLQIAGALTSPTPPYQGGETDPLPPLNKGGARKGGSVLYLSGEESGPQVKMRLARLGLPAVHILFAGETDTDAICATIEKEKPSLAIVDSIQTLRTADVEGEQGNVAQLKASTAKLLEVAKRTHVPIILIGHVTKEGVVAGPRTLEHLVDTVLYLEGDRYHSLRLLRTIKNRFGSTDEVGVFTMGKTGLEEVKNPSAAFLEERGEAIPGSVVTCLLEGTRPILVEVQALTAKASFGYPQRRANGFDQNRLQMLLAVLSRRVKLPVESHDVFVNIVGGISADEPAADLAVAMAIASALKEKALPRDLLVVGEVGLGGEVRSVPQLEKRIAEAEKLGFKYALVPKHQARTYADGTRTHAETGLKLAPVADITEIMKKIAG